MCYLIYNYTFTYFTLHSVKPIKVGIQRILKHVEFIWLQNQYSLMLFSMPFCSFYGSGVNLEHNYML